MATEKAANLAREKFSDELRDLGAHAIGVDEVSYQGKKTFAVIAYLEKKAKSIPDTLEVVVSNKTHKVPLIVRLSEKFKPE